MQEPTWSDVFAYIIAGLLRGEWPVAQWVLLSIVVMTIRVVVSVIWRWHRERQQAALVTSVVLRWLDALERPFYLLSTQRQLDAVELLGQRLVGNRELVFAVLVRMRVQMEAIPVEERVLQAMDCLASEWQEKLSPARRRRYRRLRGLGALDRPSTAAHG